ncbi:MAG: SDR family oxidoreductase [Phycisphaerales bacterium]|nr:SDR family oxidoreductase [Phycisphaerales bacterium]
MSIFQLNDKLALVTGAATGLGQAIALTLARQGATLVLTDKPDASSGLAETAELIRRAGGTSTSVPIDVRDLKQIENATGELLNRVGRVDILVNNAGINRPKAALEVDVENWDDHYHTNVRGGFFMAQKVAPAMISAGHGRIIFISSQSGLIGIPGQPVYCSTKGAVIQLVRTLGVEWAKFGITVNSVAPTFVETNLTRQRLKNPEFLKFVLGKIPAGKLATPEQVASAVAFLASDEAAMVNCHTLCVDGGWTAW